MPSILDNLNAEQIQAVKQTEGPVIVFAGAGTGKTKTLISRVIYLTESCSVNPWNILAITFTNKATREMKERLDAALGAKAMHISVSTIHSLCARILRRYIADIGYTTRFEIIDEDDKTKILTEIYKAENIDKKQYPIKTATRFISYYKNGADSVQAQYKDIYNSYERYLKENDMLDFDDLLVKTKELLLESDHAREYFQDLFKYLLVDEFQDLNRIQYDIIKLLAAKHQNLFVVGDDDQSIYSFRGATPDIMQTFKKDYPNAVSINLIENYRSHNSLLKGANAVISKNKTRETKSLHSAVEGSQRDVNIKEAYYYEEEVTYVIHEINHLVQSENLNYSDICILYRTNALSRNFELALIEESIPYKVYGGMSYLKRKEIKDIVSYFRFIVDPNRLIHLKRIVNLPSRGVGEKTIMHIESVMNSARCTIFEAFDIMYKENPSSKNKLLLDFKNIILDLREKIETMPLVEFFDYLLEHTGYDVYINDADLEEGKDRMQNLKEFKSILYNIEQTFKDEQVTNLEKLRLGLDEMVLDSTTDAEDTGNAVTLSTIHSAKGLEFEVVFVVALEEGLFPSVREDAEIEEERRIAYVAFTRAKSKIYLTRSCKRLIFGRVVQNRMSRFLAEYLTAEEVKENQDRLKIEEETESAEFTVGAKVNHKFFGYGKIIALDDVFVQVLFDKDTSIKKIKRDYQHMKVIE